MNIPEKFLKFKLHILSVFAFGVLVMSLCYLAPRFLDIVKYFWPLMFSTALFLVAVIVFGQISPTEVTEVSGEKVAEGLLDYVASGHMPSMAVPEQEEEAEGTDKAH